MGISGGSGGAEVEVNSPVSSNVTSSVSSTPVINLNLGSERIDNTSSPTSTTSPTNATDQTASLSQTSDLAASVGILGGSGGPVEMSKESAGLSDSEGPNDIISKLFGGKDESMTTNGFFIITAIVIGGGYYLWKKKKRG